MLTLYGMSSPNVHKIILMLEELELTYAFKFVDVWKGVQYSPEFRTLNPIGKVPVLVDSDCGAPEPCIVFESGAILLHLARKCGALLPSDPMAQSEAIQWLMVQLTGVGPMFGQLIHFHKYAEGEQPYSLARYTAQAAVLYRHLDERLSKTPFLGGADYSIADIATFPWIRSLARVVGSPAAFCRWSNPDFPHLWNWHDHILQRPGTSRALKFIDGIKSTIAEATDDGRDLFFRRGVFTDGRLP